MCDTNALPNLASLITPALSLGMLHRKRGLPRAAIATIALCNQSPIPQPFQSLAFSPFLYITAHHPAYPFIFLLYPTTSYDIPPISTTKSNVNNNVPHLPPGHPPVMRSQTSGPEVPQRPCRLRANVEHAPTWCIQARLRLSSTSSTRVSNTSRVNTMYEVHG